MNFDFDEIETAKFGVCTRQSGKVRFLDVPVASDVQSAIREMAQMTISAMRQVSETPIGYEPSERYAGLQHLQVGLDDPTVAFFRELRQVSTFEPGGNILRDPSTIFCYFCRFVDSTGRSLVGIRRSSSFKGVLKQKSRLVSLVSDELRMVSDDLFRLDNDFDVLVDEEHVCILRVAGFETIGGLQDAIKAAATDNVQALSNLLPFVDISLVDHMSFGVTTARQLASVKQQQLSGITLSSLRAACDVNGISYSQANGRLEFDDDALGDLLDILDRRLYVDGLVPSRPTRYKAGSRYVRD